MKVFTDLAVSLNSVRLVAIVDKPSGAFHAIKGPLPASPSKKGVLVLHNAPPLEISVESARELIEALKAKSS